MGGQKKYGGMTFLQQKFVPAYIETVNAFLAAKKAGYSGSDSTLRVTGARVLALPHVEKAIREWQGTAIRELDVDANWVIRKMKAAVEQYIGDPETAGHGIRALDMLAKHLGMFVDHKVISGRVEVTRVEIIKDHGHRQVLEGDVKVLDDVEDYDGDGALP